MTEISELIRRVNSGEPGSQDELFRRVISRIAQTGAVATARRWEKHRPGYDRAGARVVSAVSA